MGYKIQYAIMLYVVLLIQGRANSLKEKNI